MDKRYRMHRGVVREGVGSSAGGAGGVVGGFGLAISACAGVVPGPSRMCDHIQALTHTYKHTELYTRRQAHKHSVTRPRTLTASSLSLIASSASEISAGTCAA